MSVLTKQAIFSSFLKFLQEKPLDKITVKDIVDDCGINRKTFYYYFSDIYAMAEEMFRAKLDGLQKEFPPGEYSWNDFIEKASEYMYDNKKITLHVFRSVGYEKMNDLIFEISREYILPFIEKTAEGLFVSECDMKLIAGYACITIAGVITRWLSGGMKTVPKELVERFSKILDGTLRLSLENAAKLNK